MIDFSAYYYNPFVLPVAISAISVVSMGIIVFSRNTRSPVNQFFLLSCLSVFLWLFGFVMVYLSKEKATALLWNQYCAFLGVVFVTPNIFFFAKAITGSLKEPRRLMLLVYSLAFICYLLGFNDNFIIGAKKYFWGWYPLYGPTSYVFLVFFLVMVVAALRVLWSARDRMGSKVENKRVRIVFFAVLLGYLAGVDFLPTFGIGLYPLGHLIIFSWLSAIGYAVIRYKLMALTPEVVAEQVIALIPDFFILADGGGKITMVNRAVERGLGYKQEELIGKMAGIIIPRNNEDSSLANELEKKGTISNLETSFQSKNGTKIPVIFSGASISNKVGDVAGFIFMGMDITERKKREEEKEELIRELRERQVLLERQKQEVEDSRRAIKNVAEDLMRSQEKMELMQDQLIQAEKLNAVGQLASGVAHEVRNPLAIILQGVNYLENKISAKEGEISETLGMLKENIKRADRIIEGLFDFSRAASLKLGPQDLNSILEKALSLVKARFQFANIDIVMEVKQNLPRVLGDANKLEQVFINLMLNAVQAMPEGGKIIIRSFDKKLEEIRNGIGKRAQDNFRVGERAVIAEIEDTGHGITEENLKKIFDPFFTTKGPTGGAGLGLSVTRNIVHMHKGLLFAQSEPGKGTKMTVLLKVA